MVFKMNLVLVFSWSWFVLVCLGLGLDLVSVHSCLGQVLVVDCVVSSTTLVLANMNVGAYYWRFLTFFCSELNQLEVYLLYVLL